MSVAGHDVVACLEASFVVPRQQALVAVGDEATLLVSAPWRIDWGGTVEIHRGGDVEPVLVPGGDAYRLELENFADACERVAPPLLGRADALGQARAIDALYCAALEGRSVEL